MATVILGVIGLDVTTVATSSTASPASSGTVLGPVPNQRAVPKHGLGTSQRIISWSGYKWLVFPASQMGPEQTFLSNSKDNVFVDSQGRLHLAINQDGDTWRGVELEALEPMGYGTYNWTVDTNTAAFAKSTVLGLFSYRPGSLRLTNEIDVEDSQFAHLTAPNNAQFAVQPYFAPHHYHQYYIRPSYSHLYQQFQWLPGSPGTVHFISRAGATAHSPIISKWSYTGSSTPTNSGMRLFINLWLNSNHPPVGGTHSAIIRSLRYAPN
jgi:hypothetical protein